MLSSVFPGEWACFIPKSLFLGGGVVASCRMCFSYLITWWYVWQLIKRVKNGYTFVYCRQPTLYNTICTCEWNLNWSNSEIKLLAIYKWINIKLMIWYMNRWTNIRKTDILLYSKSKNSDLSFFCRKEMFLFQIKSLYNFWTLRKIVRAFS